MVTVYNFKSLTSPKIVQSRPGRPADYAALRLAAFLQDKAKMEAYVQSKGWTTFDEMQADRKALQGRYDELQKSRGDMNVYMDYHEKLLTFHEQTLINLESSLKGIK